MHNIKANVPWDETFLQGPVFLDLEFSVLSRFFNGNARKFSGVDFMTLVPKARVNHEIDPEAEKVVLLVPRYTDPIFGRVIQPYLGENKRFIRLPLDSRGSWIWRHMDGKRSVSQMVAAFSEEFPADNKDVPERLSGYLYNMWENKFLVFDNFE